MTTESTARIIGKALVKLAITACVWKLVTWLCNKRNQ